MTAGVYLGILLFLAWALRSRLPWTRIGGGVMAASLFGLALWHLREDAVRTRLLDPDRWPTLLFLALALFLSWWTLRREQVRETPIHEADDLESLARFVPRPLWPTLGLLAVIVAAAFVSAPLAPSGLASSAPGPVAATSAAALPAAPWFLTGLAFLASLVGPLLAWILLPAAVVAALFATPYLDTSHPETEGPFRGRRDEAPFFLWAWIGLGVVPLAAAGVLPTPPAPAGLVSLADAVWIDLLGSTPPSAWILRELPGLVVFLVAFVALPLWLPRWKATRGVFSRHLRRLGRRRYALLTLLVGVFALVPLGLFFRFAGIAPWLRFGEGWWL